MTKASEVKLHYFILFGYINQKLQTRRHSRSLITYPTTSYVLGTSPSLEQPTSTGLLSSDVHLVSDVVPPTQCQPS